MDNFFQNINKRLTDIDASAKLTEGAVTERDMGKHNNANTGFDALAKKAGAKYGSKAAGKRVAGAQFQKMKKAGQLEEGQCSSCNCSPCECDSMEESAFQAAIGKKKYGDQGMKALQKAGREHAGAKTMSNIRNKYNKYDEADNMSLEEQDMEEGNEFSGARQAAIKAGKSTFSVGGKTYRVTGDTSNEKQMKEGAFKKIDIERQEKAEKARHSPNKGALNQVPGMQNLKPHAKEHPLKNVARGIKAFVKGEPEPMDEAFTFNDKKGRWEWDDGTSYSMSELTPAQKERVKQWKLENPGKRPGRPPANTDRQPNNYGTRGFREQAMDEAKKSKPDYPDIDKDGDRKESMKKAAADKKGQSTAGTVFDPEYRARMKKDKEGTGNFDKKSTSTGTVHTRRHREDDEEEVKSDEPKRKGRPKGPAKAPERVTAKSYKYKSGRPVKENEIGIMNRGEYDQEGAEAKGDMHTIMRHARELETHLQDSENLPTWVIEKIGQIKGMMTSVSDYILSQQEHDTEHDTGQQGIVLVPEKAVSVAQRRAAGIARGAQKGEIPKNTLRGASKQMSRMPKGELRKFAATKEKGLPKHAESESADKSKKVKETTTSGSVAPAPNAAPKGSGKMSFGKGVYEGAISESYERKLSGVLAEGMTMSVNMGTEGQRSISVNADGEDAEKLAEILKLAGLGNASHGDMTPGCNSCGQAPCGCDTVDESYGDSAVTNNMPDWPTDPESTDNNDPYLRRLSGGLNGPKSTGQTTAPVIAGQLRRTSTMEQTVKLEQDLHRLYKSYKPRLKHYITESKHWMHTPAEGDTFGIELADGTLVESYIMETADNCILLDATSAIVRVLESWNLLSDQESDDSVILETMGYGSLVGEEELDEINRRGFLGALGVGAATAAGLMPNSAAAELRPGSQDPNAYSHLVSVANKHQEMMETNPKYAREAEQLVPGVQSLMSSRSMSFSDYQISAFKKLEPLLKKYGVTVNEGIFDRFKKTTKKESYSRQEFYQWLDQVQKQIAQGEDVDKVIYNLESSLEKTYTDDVVEQVKSRIWDSLDLEMDEAKYHGREVPLGKPMKGDVKKSKVYVRDPATGNIKKVNFGDPNMRIKKSSPARRKSFRARHHCANPGPRTKARYWSCRAW